MASEGFENNMIRNNNATMQKPVFVGLRKNIGKTSKKSSAVLIVTFGLLLCLALFSCAADAAAVKKRAIASTVTESAPVPVKMCHQNTPCGWAVYKPFTRRIDYFMKNTSCECSPEHACLKTDDDLSVNAYVYRCKTRPAFTTTNTDVESTTI